MKRILPALLLIVTIGVAGVGAFYWHAQKGLAPAVLEEKYVTSADRFIDIAGARVRVREEGPQDAPTLVLIHGYTFSLESWDAWATLLKDEFRVVRYDLLGHGLTGPDSQARYAPAERAEFFLEVMDALEIDRAVVGGNSLGGLIAWRAAAAAPERFRGLILIDAPAYPYNGVGDTPVEIPLAMRTYLKTAPEAGVRASAELVWGDDSKITDARLKVLRDMIRRRGNGDALIGHLEVFTMPDPAALLEKISAPTLIMWGARDILVSLEQARQLERAIEDAKLIVYDGVGHAPQEEAPQLTAADARSFLIRLDAEDPETTDTDESVDLND